MSSHGLQTLVIWAVALVSVSTSKAYAEQAACVYNVGNLRTAVFDDIHAPFVKDGKANHDLIGTVMTFTSAGIKCNQRNMPGTPTTAVTMKITAIQAEETLVFEHHRTMIITGTAQ